MILIDISPTDTFGCEVDSNLFYTWLARASDSEPIDDLFSDSDQLEYLCPITRITFKSPTEKMLYHVFARNTWLDEAEV